MRGGVCGVLLLVGLGTCIGEIDPGQIGLEFFGNEYAFTEEMPNFPTQDMTLTLKIKASSGNILNYGVERGSQPFDSTHLALTSVSSLTISRGSGNAWETGTNFADGDWHALAITWKMSTGEMKLYKDGEFVSSQTMAKGTTMSVDGQMVLGQFANCPVGCFTAEQGLIGTIADMTLWSKVMTAQQIEYLSTNAPAGDETGLVSFWPLNEKDGNSAKDKVGGINEILIGGPSTSDEGVGEAASSFAFNKYGAVILQPANDLPTGDFSIEFWIKTTTFEDSSILSYYTTGQDAPALSIHNPSRLTIDLLTEQINLDASVATGAWNHVAITWKQSTGRVRLYKNGALSYPPAWLPEADYDLMPTLAKDAALTARPDRVTLANKLVCAAGSCLDTGAGFTGLLSDVRVWGAVRTQEEVSAWKDHSLPSDPLPDSLLLNWKLDDVTNLQTADSSGRGQTGLPTVPKFRNNLIAPPFPTLDEVNNKVEGLKSQLEELLDYVKDIMEPENAVNRTDTAISVKDEGQCDRRYKYLCTHHTQLPQAAAPEAAATTPDASARAVRSANNMNVNVLVQRALGHNAMAQHPQLTEQLGTATHGHTHSKQKAVQAALQHVQAPPQRLSAPSPDLVQTAAPRSSAPVASGAVVGGGAGPHRRHAWATAAPVAPVSGRGGETTVRSVAHAGHRHAWSSAGAVPTVAARGGSQEDNGGVVDFLEEDADDSAPEAIVRSVNPRRDALQMRDHPPTPNMLVKATTVRGAVPSRDDGVDFEQLQRDFEEQERKFDNFKSEGEDEFPSGWQFDLSTPMDTAATEEEAPAQDPATLEISPGNPPPTAATEGAQAVVEFADVETHGDHDHHHHHHHHAHHHSHHHEEPAPAPATAVPNARQNALKQTTAASAPAPAKVSSAPAAAKADNGGVGTKFEQLIMPGSESEWDEAIAQGVGNSDLANDGTNFADDSALEGM